MSEEMGKLTGGLPLPPGFKLIASTDDVPVAGMADESRHYYALQFHPEVTHTKQGERIYQRFLHEICQCEASWNPGNIIEDAIARVRAQVGEGRVLLGLSGGVDSSVVAALLHKAIGDQLTCVFVDHGLLRLNEGDDVMRIFAKNLGVKVIRVDAGPRYFAALEGVSDPEAKRKVIGKLFIDVFEEESHKITDVEFLAQGTIYPDVIESAGAKSGKAHVIKSHHNVGGLPAHMRLKLVEPLRELFKDEVREGRTFRSAAQHGWDRAKRTIVTGNMVTLIGAVVIYFLAVGEVKGFAFTLGLTTVFDLLVTFLVTAPLMLLAARKPFFAKPSVNGMGKVFELAEANRAEERRIAQAAEAAAAARREATTASTEEK